MKIALHIPVWKRVELTRACYVGLQRIQKEFQENGLYNDSVGFVAPRHRNPARI